MAINTLNAGSGQYLGAMVSPDDRWITYVSDETSQQAILVRPYPAIDDGKWQISAQEGREPIWGMSQGIHKYC